MAPSGPNPDHQRLEALLAEHAERVRLVMLRYRLPQHGIDPDEIEQQVRIRLWKAIQRDRSGAFTASYIQRIVASTAIDAMRRARVRPSEPGAEDDEQGMDRLDADMPRPDDTASDDQRVRILARCMDELPSRRRLPISLHLEGHTFREIGDMIEVSEEAARKLVSRGMKTLRARLQELGVDVDEQ